MVVVEGLVTVMRTGTWIEGDRGACLDCVWVKIRLDTEAGEIGVERHV